MALVVKDRVKETTTTTGTGTITLAGAVDGFQSFSAALADGDTTYYAISETSTGEWEVGLGTFTATGTTLARTTVLASSNAGSAVSLTAEADVFITQPASKSVFFDASGDLTLNQDPTSALHAATKEYVDTIAAAGLHYHDPVRVEQEGNLSATYDNGTAGVGATLTNNSTQAALVIDGVTLSLNDRVLIYEQTNAYENGVYTVTDTGSASTNWVLTRSTDTDSYAPSDPDSLGQGDAFFVLEGAAGAGELYVMNTEGTITFGTTGITFTQVAATAVFTAGNGLTLTGTTFAVGAGTGVTVNANDIAIGQAVGTSDSPTFAGMTTTADITFGTDDKASFGTTLDVYSDGTDSYVVESGTGNLYIDSADLSIRNAAGTATMASFDDTGSVTLNHNNSTKFTTQSYGIDVTGNVQADGLVLAGDATFGDNDKAIFGAGSDLQIYHVSADNTSRIVEGGSGNLIIQGANLRLGNADFSKAYFAADDGGAATIYYNDAPKLATTSTGIDVTGNITVSGTVDGRDIATDGAKLDGIETGATADQTKADIDALGINAATLDSLDSTQFLRSDANDTATGSITFSNASGITIGEADIFHQTASTWRGITVKNNGDTNEVAIDGQSSDGTQRLAIYGETSSQGFLNPTNNSWKLRIPTSGSFTRDNTYTIWDSGNDGSGSGLDADLLDGVQGSSYLRSDTSDSMSGALTITGNGSYVGNWGYSTLVLQDSGGYPGIDFRYGSNDWLQRMETGGSMQWAYRSGGNYTERMELTTAGVLTLNGNTVWHAGNDGSGSGLDADLLDGYHLSTTRNAANTVPVRDASGYLQLGWINTTSGATTGTINKIYASTDDYIRYVTPNFLADAVLQTINKEDSTYYDAHTWLNFGPSNGSGLYWSTGTGAGWHIYPVDTAYMRLQSGYAGAAGIRFRTGATDRNFVYNNSSNEIGFLSTSGNWILRTTNSGQVHATSFHGDGSNLTNLPGGTASNTYQVGAHWIYTNSTQGSPTGWDTDGSGGVSSSDASNLWQFGDAVPLTATNRGLIAIDDLNSGDIIGGLEWVNNDFISQVVRGDSGFNSRWISKGREDPASIDQHYGALVMDGYFGLTYTHSSWNWTGAANMAGDQVFTANQNGITATAFVVASDIRLKENLVVIPDAVDKVSQLNGYSYTTIDNGTPKYGVVAQEVEVVMPHSVHNRLDLPDTPEEDLIKTVDYPSLIPLLIEAIKEQQSTITALEARITALEG